MRKIDEKKSSFQKCVKSINFEKVILDRLELLAKRDGTDVSKLVNHICRKVILNDIEYYREEMKHFSMKFHEAQYMKEQAEAIQLSKSTEIRISTGL